MKQRVLLIAVAAALVAGIAYAQYPILDLCGCKVVEKYQNSTCEQLWEARGKPKSEREQEVVDLLKRSAGRQSFFSKIAARSRTRCLSAE